MTVAEAALTPTHLDVLRLLVIGSDRLSIVHDLYLSARTVDQRIAELKRALGTSDRFGLGVSAIRYGSIDPIYPMAQASTRRAEADWVTPTKRQYEILHLRATGASVEEVAARIEISASSIRQHLRQLATDNGAGNVTNAGAPFEALGWIRPSDRTHSRGRTAIRSRRSY